MNIPLWFVFALVAAIFSGLNNFFNKIAAEKGFDSKVFIFWSNTFSVVVSFLGFLFFANKEFKFDWVFCGGIIIVAIGNILVILNKIKGLRYLNAGTFFVTSRFGLIGALFLIEFFGYHALFTTKSIIGLAIGFIALALLAETKKKDNKKQYLMGGMIAVGIVIITMTINNVVRKNVILMEYDRCAYYFFMFSLSFFFAAVMNYKDLKTKVIFTNKDRIKKRG